MAPGCDLFFEGEPACLAAVAVVWNECNSCFVLATWTVQFPSCVVGPPLEEQQAIVDTTMQALGRKYGIEQVADEAQAVLA